MVWAPAAPPMVSVVAAPNALTVVLVVLKTSIDALPMTEVANVGEVANTKAPVPVSSVHPGLLAYDWWQS